MNEKEAASSAAAGFILLIRVVPELHVRLRDACAAWGDIQRDPEQAKLVLLTAVAAAEFADSSLPVLTGLAADLESWAGDLNVGPWRHAASQLQALQQMQPLVNAAVQHISSHLNTR